MEKLFKIEWYRRDNPQRRRTAEIRAEDGAQAAERLKELHSDALISLIARSK
jgi:hypothetical protein